MRNKNGYDALQRDAVELARLFVGEVARFLSEDTSMSKMLKVSSLLVTNLLVIVLFHIFAEMMH